MKRVHYAAHAREMGKDGETMQDGDIADMIWSCRIRIALN
jgi:2-keto-4-pentenoate hydratase/2-oxohepta-3-ene-1,7-dioic acid hydratase in catechol pathway